METTDAKFVLLDGTLHVMDNQDSTNHLNVHGRWFQIFNITAGGQVTTVLELLDSQPNNLNIHQSNSFTIDFVNQYGNSTKRTAKIGRWVEPYEPNDTYYGLVAIGTADIADIGTGGLKRTYWIWGLDEDGSETIYLYHNPNIPNTIQIFSLAGDETAVLKIRYDPNN